jgi:hypothetical protein
MHSKDSPSEKEVILIYNQTWEEEFREGLVCYWFSDDQNGHKLGTGVSKKVEDGEVNRLRE